MVNTGQIKKNNSGELNLKMIIEYDGAAYSGWQRQKDRKSIQQTIEDALAALLQDKIVITGAGRTDAGVHAYNQCANFRVRKEKFAGFGASRLKYSLNSILPADIIIKSINKAAADFHARYSAKKREYIYRISETKTAISREYIYHYRNRIDLKAAKSFCKSITGIHSFKALCKNKEDDHGFMCEVYSAGISKNKSGIFEFKICANRFLHSMVRGLAGAMLKVSSGGMSLKDFNTKFKQGDEIKIQYLPSKALFLSKVTY